MPNTVLGWSPSGGGSPGAPAMGVDLNSGLRSLITANPHRPLSLMPGMVMTGTVDRFSPAYAITNPTGIGPIPVAGHKTPLGMPSVPPEPTGITFSSNVTVNGTLSVNNSTYLNSNVHIQHSFNLFVSYIYAYYVSGTIVQGTDLRSKDVTALVTSFSALNDGAGVSLGTLSDAPAAGNPSKWIPINDAGVTRYIPAW